MRTENSPSGRRSSSGSFIEAARRAQVVEATIETLNDVGYGGASLARIATQARISKSVISYHFAGKDDLFEEVVLHVLADCAEFMRGPLEAEVTAAGRLRAHITSELAYMESHPANFVALGEIIINHRDDSGARRFPDDLDEGTLGELLDIFAQGQRDGEFRDFDPHVLAVTVSQAVDGALSQWASGSIGGLRAYGEELVTLFELATLRTASTARDTETPGRKR